MDKGGFKQAIKCTILKRIKESNEWPKDFTRSNGRMICYRSRVLYPFSVIWKRVNSQLKKMEIELKNLFEVRWARQLEKIYLATKKTEAASGSQGTLESNQCAGILPNVCKSNKGFVWLRQITQVQTGRYKFIFSCRKTTWNESQTFPSWTSSNSELYGSE